MIVRRLILQNFRIIDTNTDAFGSVFVEDGIIKNVFFGEKKLPEADITINGGAFGSQAVLMPAFIDLHAHFRESCLPAAETTFPVETTFPKETIESASLAAAAGGFATVFCMANTMPPIDTLAKAHAIKARSDALGVIDLYPVLSLTKNMEGRELSAIQNLPADRKGGLPLLLSEDGKDIANNELFLAAMAEARRLGVPVSCHCDFGGPEAETAKAAGRHRAEWSRIEENNAVRRAIELGKQAGCHIHIAHVSTKEAVEIIKTEKEAAASGGTNGFTLTCEAAPHHIGATENDARLMGAETFGRVNPPLRTEADRQALVAAIGEGVIDAIATDHAPHGEADKAAGSPGFSALETAFAVCLSTLTPAISLRRLSELLSAIPARITALDTGAARRGLIEPGMRADMVIADTAAQWNVDPAQFKSRGKCSPFTNRTLRGKILLTISGGRIVYTSGGN
jgi:dihydroorotase